MNEWNSHKGHKDHIEYPYPDFFVLSATFVANLEIILL